MGFQNCADKVTGLLAYFGWTGIAATATNGTALATLAEPVSGTVIVASQLAAQFSANGNEPCAAAIKKARKTIEKSMQAAIKGNAEFGTEIERAFADIDFHFDKLGPTYADLVGLWRLDPAAIANGLMERLADMSETVRDNHVARQIIIAVFGQAVETVRDDPVLHANLQPELARQYLADLGQLKSEVSATKAAVEDMSQTVRAQDSKLDRILELLEKSGDADRAKREGVQERAIIELARTRSRGIDDFDQALAALKDAVEVAIQVQREGRHSSNLGTFVDEVLQRVTKLSAEGYFENAASEAEIAYAQWQQDESERQEAAKAQGIKLIRAAAEQYQLAGSAIETAKALVRLLELETPDLSKRYVALRALQGEWYEQGRDHGLNFNITVSIELARSSLRVARGKDQRGQALGDLGIALWLLGERESGMAPLEEAVAVYRKALKECTRERAPLEWAWTQYRIGIALSTMSYRESGTARLDEAVVAYREALKEFTSEREPLFWASTQNYLGSALLTLGERESSIELLEEAVVAYREALKGYTSEIKPLQWAWTQMNLSRALQTLGEREAGTTRFEETVEALREALKGWTRQGVPHIWATLHFDLALVHETYFDKIGDKAMLTEALEFLATAEEGFIEVKTTQDIEKVESTRPRIQSKLTS